jgi:hypothetical protein
MCKHEMVFRADIVEGNWPRDLEPRIVARVYQCPVHGMWRVNEDGKILPHADEAH